MDLNKIGVVTSSPHIDETLFDGDRSRYEKELKKAEKGKGKHPNPQEISNKDQYLLRLPHDFDESSLAQFLQTCK